MSKCNTNFSKIYPTILFTLVVFFLTLYIYYPGIVTNDTISAFNQAKNFSFTDISPPIMPLTWFLLNHIYYGTLSVLVFNNIVFWVALCIFSFWLLPKSNFYRIIFIFLFGFFPPVFTQLGVILKDIPVFSFLFLACALLLFTSEATNKKNKLILLLFAVMFLFYAYILRHNSFAAVIALCFWVGSLFPYKNLKFAKILSPLIGIILVVLFFVANNVINKKLLDGYVCYPSQVVLISDLVGISAIEGKVIFPDSLLGKKKSTHLITVYDPAGNYDVNNYMDCDWDNFRNLREFWFKSVLLHYPLAYIKHRAMTFSRLFVSSSQYNYVTDNYVNEKNPYGFEFYQNYFYKLYYKFADLFVFKFSLLSGVDSKFYPTKGRIIGLHILFMGGFYWLICLFVAIRAFCLRKKIKNTHSISWIALSGFLYGLGYVVYAVTPEYRFWLWTVVASLVSSSMFVRERYFTKL